MRLSCVNFAGRMCREIGWYPRIFKSTPNCEGNGEHCKPRLAAAQGYNLALSTLAKNKVGVRYLSIACLDM